MSGFFALCTANHGKPSSLKGYLVIALHSENPEPKSTETPRQDADEGPQQSAEVPGSEVQGTCCPLGLETSESECQGGAANPASWGRACAS